MRKTNDLLDPVTASDHAQGKSDAPITLLEYGDYQCPYCVAAYPEIKRIQKALGRNVRFVFRNFPITTSHPDAESAAEAAEAAGAQGKFWEMHDALYENEGRVGPDDIAPLVPELGLDEEQFAADMD
ncbi:TPA: thioredoxin domain-containing protein, partial [Listeria monocytogenes]|nr:thioredoxin domain-containing protein [Listeria monocytogenes]